MIMNRKTPPIRFVPVSDTGTLREMGAGNAPAVHEDGMRTNGCRGTYEWWYIDASFTDGTTAAVGFYTKPMAAIHKPLSPMVEVDYSAPDGTRFNRVYNFPADAFSASTGVCDVKIGNNYFRGDADLYEVHVETDDSVVIDFAVERRGERRPIGGGCNYYGDFGEYIGLYIAAPQGRIAGSITIDGRKRTLEGRAYHDHNWGTCALQEILDCWYWFRTDIGPYTAVGSGMCNPKSYTLVDWSAGVLLTRDGNIIDRSSAARVMFRSTQRTRTVTGKLVKDIICYCRGRDGGGFEVMLTKERDISAHRMRESRLVRLLGRFHGNDIGYHRMGGKGVLRIFESDRIVETLVNPACAWEMMSFANAE